MECALKACIAKLMKSEEFPDKNFAEKCWTHNLEQLIELAGLEVVFEAALATDSELRGNWKTVKDWDEASRYVSWPKGEAEGLFEAITNNNHGVLSWIKGHW